MSTRLRAKYGKKGGQESSPVAPEAKSSKRRGNKKSQQVKPPTEIPKIKPEEKEEGATAIQVDQGMDQDDDKKMDPKKTEGEHGDDPDVEEKTPLNLKPETPGAGDEQE